MIKYAVLILHTRMFAENMLDEIYDYVNLQWYIKFFVWETLLQATAGWNWQKIKQKLSSTKKLNLRYLKIIPSSSKNNGIYSKKYTSKESKDCSPLHFV